MAGLILVLNAGSSSIKFSAFALQGDALELVMRGQVEGIYSAPRFSAVDGQGNALGARTWDGGAALGHDGAIAWLAEFLRNVN
ncbi:MAG TPA: acetate kinase, partial [Rhizobacter sp.]|nr:acetate kinase [Rhizobacter sp.]